jgi:predicted homoserine dehydrogenase-like protein
MILVDKALEQREREKRPIRIGLVGAGFMGRALTWQINRAMLGMEVVAIANRTVARAAEAFHHAGSDDVEEVNDAAGMAGALAAGHPVVTPDPLLLAAAEGIDALIEATGEIEHGARVAVAGIDHHKHVVLVNAELDATVGPVLKVRAEKAGIVLTNADGDEPAVAMNLLRLVRAVGYRPVMAGNIKGFYDPHRDPETQAGFAADHDLRPKMATSFADGTKLSMEAAVLANATGFGVAKRGMTGFRCADVREIIGIADLAGLLSAPVVDFVLGAEPGSGAFVVGYDPDPDRRSKMAYFKMGEGPFHVFHRPFHLTHLEAPLSVARAVLFGDAAITPLGPPTTEVVAVAKRDLEAGEVLDGVGGFSCYGMIDNLAAADAARALPMGLSEGCVVKRPVAADTVVTRADVKMPTDRLVDRLREEQEAMFAKVGGSQG